APPAEEAPPVAELVRSLVNGSTLDGWHVEQDTGSHGDAGIAAGPSDPELSFQFSLADGPPATQMAALVNVTAEGLQDADRIAFTVRAERPMRVSVQLRSKRADRWQRSIYVDATPVEKIVRFDDMTAIGSTPTPAPPLADIQSIMFVVDLTNNRPGSSGKLWLSGLRLERYVRTVSSR
ncbi:MAG TPA: hypothetical protein VEU08_15630, partial [Vicinamibacterales bacterium]|nr:hypothetical protein [Vicinamibacterales bacterium]